MFWSFHPLAVKTDNEHLPKPFFKVIWKSLYRKKFFFSSLTNSKVHVWISHRTLLVFDVLVLSISISEILLFSCLLYYFPVCGYHWDIITSSRVSYITFRYFSVFGYQMKHAFSCLIYYLSVFGYQMKNSLSYLMYYLSVFGYQMKHSFSCWLYITYWCFDIEWNTSSRV